MIDFDEPQSPGWWLNILGRELQERRLGRSGGKRYSRSTGKPQRVRPGLDLLHDHLEGDPPLLNCARGWDEHFREVVRLGRLNVAALAIESKSNRMKLRDFRTAAPDDTLGDVTARDIMRANNMRVVARDVHDGMLALADSYVTITPPSDTKYPLVTAEDARECITAHDPASGKTLASLKMFRDDWDSADLAYLFIRIGGTVRQFVAVKPRGISSLGETPFRVNQSWDWKEDTFAKPVPANRMPVVRFRNYRSRGEYEPHLATLDRINDKIVNEMTIAKVQAFRQRAIKGLPDTQKQLVDGKMIEQEIDYSGVFEAAPGSLWQVPADVEFWESSAVDLSPIRMAIKDDLEHFAAVTSTPLHTITPDAASGSAEGASLMRESSVDAAMTRIDYADRSWAEVMATCFAFMGDTVRADVTQIEPIWGPVERYSLSERADAASKAKTTLPDAAIQTDIWQYAPADVPVLRAMRGADLLFQAPSLSAPTSTEGASDGTVSGGTV